MQPPAALVLKGRHDTAHPRVQAIEKSGKGKGNNNVCNALDTRIPEELKQDGKARTREEEWLPEAMRDEVRKLEDLERQLNHIVKPEVIQEELVEREWKTQQNGRIEIGLGQSTRTSITKTEDF